MSTFDGIVEEFPDIQIDYFRKSPERPAPLACFLSHVHSDHLQGLESFRAPFIYCSPATRELLLRIEKYPHRMNFSKGILESRRLHYKHLAKLLRPIPLNTPTEIELTPRRRIRVTLFDANHCTGAVMFLIEGDGKAILYTGDIRAESWWVNSLVRHPVLIPFTLGRKRLDKLYLDTTFARAANIFRHFPSKADGLAELLSKVDAYPDHTVFYFRAWTFGYEDVWLALSSALNTKVHVDRYQMGLYRSLAQGSGSRGASEAPGLCGFELGNRVAAGCLSESTDIRIHSCERGVSCVTARQPGTVYIIPIVNRTSDGAELPEVGAGGGIGDLYQTHELELPDERALSELEKLCFQHIRDEQVLVQMRQTLLEAFMSKKKALSLDWYGINEEEDISLERMIATLGRGLAEGRCSKPEGSADKDSKRLPNTIRFPYSRHSSYSELCEIVAAFRPKDIFPCTVDPASWNEDVSMRRLFGHLCSDSKFAHDAHMREILAEAGGKHGGKKRGHCDDQFLSCSTQETDSVVSPSSLQTVTAAQVQIGEEETEKSLNLASLSPDTARSKRNKVRQARLYLEEHAERELFYIGTLPSSWPAEAEDRSLSQQKEETHTAEPGKGQNIEVQSSTSPAGDPRSHIEVHLSSNDNRPKIRSISANPNSNNRETQPENATQTDSQYTDTLSVSLSISESALASQPLPLEPGSSSPREEPARDDELRDTTSTHSTAHSHKRSRTRARAAAYLAARKDSYSAWADVSLVSAGDNHTEEEIEL